MSEETSVQVALRIRPLVSSEISRGCQQCIEKVLGEPQVQVRGDRYFTFNYVFDALQSQNEVYDTAVRGLVTRLFKGYNVTILAYGQTGSGKTYSMGTCFSEGADDPGIIPRAVGDIFNTIAEKEGWEFKISVSFIELYQEQLFDLLAQSRCSVDIREENKEIRIPNLTEIRVSSPEETLKCLTQGSAGRATGATAMNSQSSRSHAIFTINIHQQDLSDMNNATTAKFHLVDLAGSERSKKTMATGERFKEGVNINRGLLALGNVISALGEEGPPKSFIGYRDSKLTRLLQDSLGGNSITLMIACVSPADYNLEETISTLRYADRAKRIKNKPIVNQDQRTAELLHYKQELRNLHLELLAYRQTGNVCPPEHMRLAEENVFFLNKIRRLTDNLATALVESASLSEVALTAEKSREQMKKKLSDLKMSFTNTLNAFNSMEAKENLAPEIQAALEELNRHKEKITDIEADQQRCCEEILKKELSHNSFNIKMDNNENDSINSTADIDQRHEEHTMQQQELNKELKELNRALALKEELASEIAKSSHQLKSIAPATEGTMKEYAAQIDSLQKEKERLLLDLKNMQHNTNSTKLAEQRRKRLQELEHKIADLTKKVTEQAKIIKMNEQNDRKIMKLNEDIQAMKQNKVRLVRQMRGENERFREWQLERKREICKLKDQDRRRQNQIVRMERLHTKQQNVLKRKWENASAVNKRLMEALAKQKIAQERRLNQAGSSLNRLQTTISQEVEVVVSRMEATRTLDNLLEDRAMMHKQCQELHNNLNEDGLTEMEKQDIENEIQQLCNELAYRNAQIEDLQQKLVTVDQDNKLKLDCIQSMSEAKFAAKYLFDLVIEAKRDVAVKDSKLDELQEAHQQTLSKLEECEKKLTKISHNHQEELLSVEKEHQDKILVLLREIRSVNVAEGSTLANSLHSLIQGLEKMDSLKDEVEKRDAQIAALKNQIVSSATKNGRLSLFPAVVPLQPATMRKTFTKNPSTKDKVDFIDIEDEDPFSEDDTDKDPDWKKTPIFKRIQKMKTNRLPTVSHIEDVNESAPVKRNSDGQTKCTCKGMCKNKLCGCKKVGVACGPDCKCDSTVCLNKKDSDATSITGNATSSSDENGSQEESFKKPRLLPLQLSNRLI